MRRWILKAGAVNVDGLFLEEAPIPNPGPGEVRIRVHAVSLNYRDQIILTGKYGQTATEDLIPVSDGAGVIDAVGLGVDKWKVNDHVVGIYFKDWPDGPPVPGMGFGLGSNGQSGMLAEYVILTADRVTAAPKTLSLAEASTLPCAALTAWTALNGDRPYCIQITQGDKVLVVGTGGVSLFGLLLARAAGADVIATSSQDDKLERVRKLGASDTINYKKTENWGEEAFGRTGGVQRVVNAAGGSAMDQSIAALAFGGEVAFMGLFDQATVPPNFLVLMMKAGSIRGTSVGSAAAFVDLIQYVDAKHIKPPIDQTFAFEQVKEAYHAQASPDTFGKIVIQVAQL